MAHCQGGAWPSAEVSVARLAPDEEDVEEVVELGEGGLGLHEVISDLDPPWGLVAPDDAGEHVLRMVPGLITELDEQIDRSGDERRRLPPGRLREQRAL